MLAMLQSPVVDDEVRRLAALHALDLLDTDAEGEYDAVAALASDLLDKPVAFISLIDRDRQWMKARHNAKIRQTPRALALCNHTIRSDKMLVVPDAMRDSRFRDNPLVAVPGGIRFYAGMPVHSIGDEGDAQAVGALCVIDTKPGTLTDRDRGALRRLALLVEALFAARLASRRAEALAERQADELARQDRAFRHAERMAKIGSWRYVPESGRIDWSDGVFQIYGVPPDRMPTVDAALDRYPQHARDIVVRAIERSLATGEPFHYEVDFVAADGDLRRVRTIGEAEIVDGAVVAILGVFQDITDRYRMEQKLRRSADHDELTGIANRAAFNRTLKAAIAAPARDTVPLMLALIDLDGFKEVNDTLGHIAGDDVLRAIGRRLREPWLHGSFPARLGGDEFALIVEHPALTADPAAFADRLQRELCVPVTAGRLSIGTAGTVGTALLDAQDNIRDFIHAADTCLYAAKRRRSGDRFRNERSTAG